jgi:hypothetical protein
MLVNSSKERLTKELQPQPLKKEQRPSGQHSGEIGGSVVDLRVDWLRNPPKAPFCKGASDFSVGSGRPRELISKPPFSR